MNLTCHKTIKGHEPNILQDNKRVSMITITPPNPRSITLEVSTLTITPPNPRSTTLETSALTITGSDPGAHPAPPPPKIGKNMIFWRKIVIFSHNIPQNISRF